MRDKLIFILIAAVGVFMRLYPLDDLNKRSLTFNGGDGLAVSSTNGSLWNFDRLLISRDQAPLKYVILHYFLLWGREEFIIHLPAFLFGIAGIFMIYILGSSLFSRKVGLLSSFFLSISPWHIHHSCDSEMYTLYVFLSLLCVYCFYNILIKDSLWLKVMFVLSSVLGFYSFYPFLCIILVEIGWLILFYRKDAIKKNHFFLFAVIGVFLFLSLNSLYEGFLWKKSFGDYRWGRGLAELFPELLSTFGGIKGFIPLNIFIFIFGFIILLRKGDLAKRQGVLLFSLVVLPGLFFFTCFLLFRMNITGRYLIYVYPYFIIVAAFGLSHIRNKVITTLLIFLFNAPIILFLLGRIGFNTIKYIPYDYMRREVDFSLLAKYIVDNYHEGDGVVVEQERGIFALQYFIDKNNSHPVELIFPYCGRNKYYYRYDGDKIKNLFGLIELDGTPQRLKKIWRDYNRLWLIELNHLPYVDTAGMIQSWIDVNYSQKVKFHGAVIYLFEDYDKKEESAQKSEKYACSALACFLDCKGSVRKILYPF